MADDALLNVRFIVTSLVSHQILLDIVLVLHHLDAALYTLFIDFILAHINSEIQRPLFRANLWTSAVLVQCLHKWCLVEELERLLIHCLVNQDASLKSSLLEG